MPLLTALGLTALVAALAACKGEEVDIDQPRRDATVSTGVCQKQEDCGGVGVCMAGVCQSVIACTVATEQTDCAPHGMVCHSTRAYCVQCDGRHQNECPAGKTCQFDFTCVDIGGGRDGGTEDGGSMCSGSCTDRSMCSNDTVCKAGSCCPPPRRCTTTEDCPTSRPECNGATGECFGGGSCTRPEDCATRPGCAGNACTCAIPMGQTTGECRMATNECDNDAACMDPAKYCNLVATPRRCMTAPPCADDQACAGAGLVCDLTVMKCKNGAPCPMGNECPQTQACVSRVCVPKNCINTPSVCTAGQTCNAQGMCVTPMGTTCTSNTMCPAGQYCDSAAMRCFPGCRDNTECPMGAVCDASHQCQSPGGAFCGPCMSNMDCPTGAICGLFSRKCVEQCPNMMCPMSGGTCGPFGLCLCGP